MSDCPPETDLLAFHLGTLGDDEVERVADHLETCTLCEAAIQQLDTRIDPLLAALRKSPPSSDLLEWRIRSGESFRYGPDEAVPVWPEWPDLPGYEILGVLGRGGMGIVYKGRQVSLNRLVALKCLRTGSNKEAVRSRAEAEALGRLQHPYIVQIHEVIEHQGRVFLALEFVAGGSLSSKLTGKPQPCEAAAQILELVARAVHHAHINGIVHRDLKPANVLLACGAQESELRAANHGVRSTPYGLPKIADFGLAKLLVEDSGQTEHGDVLGTANYMAPEQAAGRVDLIGPATDIYSLGVVLYELLTGRVPLQGTTTLETLTLVRNEEPVSPRRLQPQIPRDLETICLKCLEKEPAGRYASAAALADDLHSFLHHVPIRARPITFWERGWKWAKRRPAVAALSVALTLVAVLGVAAVAWQWRRAEEKAAGELLARRAAENNQKQVERLSVSMMLDQAAGLCESGEVARGLLWMGQALETSQRIGAPDLERVARSNLASWRPFLVRKRAEASQGTGVSTAAFSPSGDALVTAGSDGAARFWDVATGNPVGQPLRLNGPVHSVAYDRRGKAILAGAGEGQFGQTRLWDADSGEPLNPPLAHAGPVTVVAFAGQEGETFVTVSPQKARLWRTADCQPIGSSMTHGPAFEGEATGGKPQPMTAVVSPDGRLIATGGCDKMVRLWNSTTAEPVGEPLLATHPVVVLAFSPDSKTLLAGSLDGGVRMWDVATGQRRGESLRLRGNVRVVAFSPDARIAAAAGAVGYEDREPSGEVQLCQVETGQNLGGALAHPEPVRALAFSPQGRLLLTGCEDGQARLFVTATGAPVGKPLPHDASLAVVSFRPDGRIAVTATGTAKGSRACLKFWQAPDERAFGRPLVQPGELAGVEFGGDGTTLTTTTRDGAAREWDLDAATSREVPLAGQPVPKPPEGESSEEPAAVSPDGSVTLVAGSDGVARLRDTATGKTLGPPIGRDGVRAVAYSANPPRLAATCSDGKIVVWDAWSPLEGSAERVTLSIEWLTGLELVLPETIRPLSEERLCACRERLDELGGPLLVDEP